ncbi:MAG: Fic family protein [Synergistaceae bacterium]|nr:Fic family protein [Synergistaceae bacterium]
MIRNHPFHDGNKRVGAMVLLSTLKRNRIRLKQIMQNLHL